MNGEEMKLLGCPFCGCAPAVSSYETGNEDDVAWVVACDCKLAPEDQPYAERYLSAHGQTREEAVRHWNARAPVNRPAPEAGESGLIERLRRVSDRRSLTIGAIWTIAGEAADEITRLQAELAEARDQDRLIMVLAEVREASGVGHKPMLDEVPGAIRARFEEIEALATRAEAQRDALAEALRFYAEPISYIATQAREPRTAVHGDEGKRARQALASLSPAKDEEKGNG